MRRYILLIVYLAIVFSCPALGVPYDLDYRKLMSSSIDELVHKGNAYYNRHVLDSALICYSIVSGKYNPKMSDNEKASCAYAYFRSGNIHYMMYSYVRAQDMYYRSLEISQECKADTLLPRLYNNLGNIYSSFYDFRKAENYYKKAYEKGLALGDSALRMKLLHNLIGVYSNLNENDTLNHYLDLSQQLLNDTSESYFYLSGRGVFHFNNGHYRESISAYKRAMSLAGQMQLDANYRCSALCNISDAFLQLHRNDSAEYYLKRCAELAVDNGLLDMQISVYRKLAQLCSLQNRADEFLYYTNMYRSIDDSIQGMQGYRNLKDVEFLFEMNQIDKKIETLRMEQMLKEERYATQRVFLYVVMGGLLVIAFLLVLTLKQKRYLQHSYEDIFKRNSEIVEADKKRKMQFLKYEEEMAERDRQLQLLRSELAVRKIHTTEPADGETGVQEADNEAVADNDTSLKYQSSSLSREQREQLLQSINDVMENTLEFCSVDFTLERMASLTHSKTKYVSQVINETYGKNFNRYVNEYRIKEARSRLQNRAEYGQFTVKAIALSVGFKSNTNFNQLFKEMTGITPSMYLSMAQK